jgi:phosphate acetyltransferase
VDELDGNVWWNFLNNEMVIWPEPSIAQLFAAFERKCPCITPGDRADIILGALQANESANYPTIWNSIDGNMVPDDSILKLIEGLTSIVPIISVEGGDL